jgi:outer membrane biosynthesis protein TonB
MFATQFENEEKSFRNRKTATAFFVTATVHALILLVLIFTILHTPDPPYEDNGGGMSVNFGTDETGMGDVQPFTYNPTTAENAPVKSTATAETETQPEKIITQDNSESEVTAPKANDKPKTKTSNKPSEKTTKVSIEKPLVTPQKKTNDAPPQPKADPNALFTKGAFGKPNNSKGDGTGNKSGDQGKPDGDPNSKSYLDGEGKGTGPEKGDLRGVSLKGRKSTSLPAPKFCNERGNVIIDITVDRSGTVVDAKYHREGSTITDNCSIENAKRAAKLSRFNPDEEADDMQFGSINYVFTLQ